MQFSTVAFCTSLSVILMLARCAGFSEEAYSQTSTLETATFGESLNIDDRKLEHWSLCNRSSQSHGLGQSPGSCICSKREGSTIINCSNGNWDSIPEEFPPNTSVLIMSNNNIKHIRCGDFRNLPNLTVLDLSSISLETINSTALHNLTRLEYLDISFNPNYAMTNYTVDRLLFQGLKSLKTLKMFGNTQYLMPGTYPDMAISELTSLEELWMDGMQNRTFGPGFRNLTKLTTLKLSGGLLHQDNVIRYCSTDIMKRMLDNLQYIIDLDLRACYITYIDENAFDKNVNLKVLDLSKNIKLELSGVKRSFHSLAKTKIEVLKLNKIYDRQYNNCGVYIKTDDIKGIKNLKYLKEIQLKNNWITKMDQQVSSEFPNTLEVVEVSNNEFRMGMYMLFINKLSGVKKLNCSYQFFPNLLKTGIHPSFYEGVQTLTRNNVEVEETYHGINGFEESLREYMYERRYQTRKKVGVDVGPVCSTLASHMMQYLTPELPPKLEVLDMSYSKLAHPIYAFNISANNSLKTANLSSCLLHCWDGPVQGMKNLEYLDLGNNFCTKVRASFFDSFPNLRTLILSNNLLNMDISSDTEGRLLKYLLKLDKLLLSFNRLEIIPKIFFKNQVNIKHLDLSRNVLRSFDIKLDHMTHLKMLNLSKNAISTIEEDLRNDLRMISARAYGTKRKPLVVDLSHNSIACTCNNLDFLKWIKNNNGRFLTILTTTCTFDNRSKTSFDISHGQSLNEAIGLLEKQCASYFALAASLAGLLIFVFNSIIGMSVYRYRWKLRYWYYITRNQRRKRSPEYQPLLSMSASTSHEYAPVIGAYKYHAYVAYPESDKNFVLGTLRKRLKINESLRLCVPEIDFVPGQSKYRMISNAIHSSKVAIFVVSQDSFLDSEWEIAIHMAQEESLNRGKTCFFAIFLDSVPINRMLSKRWVDLRNMYRDKRFLIYRANISGAESEVFWQECLERINQDD